MVKRQGAEVEEEDGRSAAWSNQRRCMLATFWFIFGTFTSQLFLVVNRGSGMCPRTPESRNESKPISVSPNGHRSIRGMQEATLVSSSTRTRTAATPNNQSFSHNNEPGRYMRYYELHNQVKELATALTPQGKPQHGSNSVLSRARVVRKAPWLPRRRMCKETCCVEAVAISLDQDKQNLIHCRDGSELADIFLPSFNTQDRHVRFHAANLHEALLPCLVPGTIITIHSMWDIGRYFWEKARAKIQVPYVFMTTGTDVNSPQFGETYMGDPLLMHWYGTNPRRLTNPIVEENIHKFHPMKLGLSGYNHPQERDMLPYQKLNNFANPFLDKSRWDLSKQPLDFDKDVFVKFGVDRPHRQALWWSICPNTTVYNTTSCGSEKIKVPGDQVYADMSRYRFGVSPTGAGWDCYRTYEMLYLGVIPVVEYRDAYTQELFEGLPVIFVPELKGDITRKDILNAISSYVTSDTFLNTSFEAGWESLFFHHRRRQVLKDTGRDREIVVDEYGREYYQAYRYTLVGEEYGTFRYCWAPDKPCNVQDDEKDITWLDKPREMSDNDKNWIREWEEKGKLVSS